MKYRVLGRSGVQVSTLCLGTMMLGRWGNREHRDCIRIIHAALDAGINFIDTADVYSGGESEEIVAKALEGRREHVVLATKVHHPMGGDINQHGSTRRWITRAVEDSLRRLGTDWIDLYQLHRPDPLTEIGDTLSVLTDLVREGKIRMIGSCTFPAALQVEAAWAAERRGLEPLRCNQPPYSILVRGAERDSLPTSMHHGMGVICWSPLGGGWLTGRYRLGQPLPASGRSAIPMNRRRAEGLQPEPGTYDLKLDEEQPTVRAKLVAIEQLVTLANESGQSLPELALGFVLKHPAVASAIVGPRVIEHLETVLAAAELQLHDDILDQIDRIVPPGTDVDPSEAGYQPPSITEPSRRRRV
jgi:aryl-alcohol dehydrogenase (NADP+)